MKVFWQSAVLAAVVVLTGCGFFDNNHKSSGTAPNFATTVVIGDSLSAGFQSGSLLDTQQPNGWASLVAMQAGFKLALPLIAPPGVPAVLQLVSVGPPPVIKQASGTSSGRDDTSVQAYDLAVPGHKLNDLINAAPTAAPTTSEDIITDLVLGFPLGNDKSQLNQAVALNPTTVFVWIGANDALVADTSGSPSSMSDTNTFTQQFHQVMTTLHTQTHASLIVANIPDVTLIPYLTPGSTVLAQMSNQTGISQQDASTDLGIQASDLVNATGMGQVQDAISALKQGKTPKPLTDAGFLNAAEITQVQATVAAYNTTIQSEAAAVGALVVDVHGLIGSLAQNGTTINGYHATTAFLGGLFSLDGEHPTNTGYALIANAFIDAMNQNLHTNIKDVDVSAVASADPLFGSNIKPAAGEVSIPVEAARTLDVLVHR